MSSTKTRRIVAVVLIAAVLAVLGILYFSMETPAAVETEFDAWEYIDAYDKEVDHDADFGENLAAALCVVRSEVKVYGTWFALLPPVIAIALALLTKEVYSSLFIGIPVSYTHLTFGNRCAQRIPSLPCPLRQLGEPLELVLQLDDRNSGNDDIRKQERAENRQQDPPHGAVYVAQQERKHRENKKQ